MKKVRPFHEIEDNFKIYIGLLENSLYNKGYSKEEVLNFFERTFKEILSDLKITNTEINWEAE